MKVSLYQLKKRCFTRPEKKLQILSRGGVYFSWLFLKMGIPTNFITLFWVFLKFIGVLLLLPGEYLLAVIGMFLYNIIAPILDNADGHMFRYRKESSALGIFLEDIGHSLLIPLLYICLGLGIYIKSGGLEYAFIGFFASLMFYMRETLNKEGIIKHKKQIVGGLSTLSHVKNGLSEWFETEYPLSILFLGILFNLPKQTLLLYFLVLSANFTVNFLKTYIALVKFDRIHGLKQQKR